MDTTDDPIRSGTPDNVPEPNGSGSDGTDARLELINRYRHAAFDKSDVLDANLALVTADFLDMAYRQQQMLEQVQADGVDSPRKRDQYKAAVATYLVVGRQLERYVQVIRAEESRKAR
jgi:hypothetical protein